MPDLDPDILRLGVFGGSLDPVHVGHVELVKRAQEAFGLERVLWIPAHRPPHKPGRTLAPDHMRLAMTLIATIHEHTWEVSGLEFDRPGPSYTYDTLLEIEDVVKPHLLPQKDGGRAKRRRTLEPYLIIGSDNLPGLPGWKNAEDVLSIARPIVVWRGGPEPEEMLSGIEERVSERALERLRAGFLRLPPLPFSSTEIRAALARGEAPMEALHYEVLEFIAEKGLYGWPPSAELPPDPRPPVRPLIPFVEDPTERKDPGIRRRDRRRRGR